MSDWQIKAIIFGSAMLLLAGMLLIVVRAVSAIEDWRDRRADRIREQDAIRRREARARAHREHPVVHRWPPDRGAA